ncbi:MAG: sigma-70 family RNA polymerase sigma factor [Myxococcota bacterium]
MMAAVAERVSERELDDLTLARARRGEREAQRALVLRYQRPVWALLRRHLGTEEDIEDLAQETFLRVFRALPSFRSSPTARLSTWILTIAIRLAVDRHRRTRRSPFVDREVMVESPAPGPDCAFEQRATGEAIARAVEALPPEYRAAFILRAYHDFDYREIGEALGCDVGTVKSRISRARARLRQELQKVDV